LAGSAGLWRPMQVQEGPHKGVGAVWQWPKSPPPLEAPSWPLGGKGRRRRHFSGGPPVPMCSAAVAPAPLRRCSCAPPRSAAPCSVPPLPFGAATATLAAAPPPLQCPAARLPTPSAAVTGRVRRWCRSHPRPHLLFFPSYFGPPTPHAPAMAGPRPPPAMVAGGEP